MEVTLTPRSRMLDDFGGEIVLVDWTEDMLVLAPDVPHVLSASEEWFLFAIQVRLPPNMPDDATLRVTMSGGQVLFGRAWSWAIRAKDEGPHQLAMRLHVGGMETIEVSIASELERRSHENENVRVFFYGLHKKLRA